jgi:hypothetical protein
MHESRNFCVQFNVKNYYNIFHNWKKFSQADLSKVLSVAVDIDSSPKELQAGIAICNQSGIQLINPLRNIDSNGESVILVDDWLTQNNIDVDWIFNFELDSVPLHADFWDKLDAFISSNKWLDDSVGLIGVNTYLDHHHGLQEIQNPDKFIRNNRGTRPARGNLLGGLLEHPHSGWYQNFSKDRGWFDCEYFVIESPKYHCFGLNRKLFKKYINIDNRFKHLYWVDDIAHQFMQNNIFNIFIPDLFVSHADIYIKQGIHLPENLNYTRSTDSHIHWKEKYGWPWGYRNKTLREDFQKNMHMYKNTIQEKLYNSHILDGPKQIEDYL